MHLQPPPLPPPRAKNWFERNLLWFIPTIILFGIASVGGFVALLFGFIKSSDAYQGALTRIQTSPAAIEALGEPITDGFFFTGQINIHNSDGNARLEMNIKGSRAKATAYVVADRSLGQWHYTRLILALRGTDTRLDLSDPVNSEPSVEKTVRPGPTHP
ncbi:MAG TPA: cytochrome c oxidase assembly factor Coa1 family protein [Roseimicrobium sp.]|nr:cytochrome c oxidase assembly factor Coa1 family protein [Roseimicrobium sp.]